MARMFRDRIEAGQVLAAALGEYADRPGATVLGLPRGGVPVAAEVARALNLPLDVMVVRKLGVPGREELAFGAIAGGGATVLNESLVRQLDMPPETISRIVERERREVEHREQLYRGDRSPPELTGRTVMVIDDGVATGATMRVAVQMARQLGAQHVVAAVPVAPPQVVRTLAEVADRVVCPSTPELFHAVGQWYEDFDQIMDDQVRRILHDVQLQRSEGTR